MKPTSWVWAGVACLALTGRLPADELQLSPDERSVIELTNKERAAQGLPALKVDPKLVRAARDHSSEMARQDKLSHDLDGKGPSERLREIGYRFAYWGENIAGRQPTPEEALKSWMNSPFHRANILNREFSEFGVGIARDGQGRVYYTQVFASPAGQIVPGPAHPGNPLVTTKFTVENRTDKPVTVNLVGTPDKFTLPAGATGTYTMIAGVVRPEIRFTSDGADVTIPARDGGRIRLTGDGPGRLSAETVAEP